MALLSGETVAGAAAVASSSKGKTKAKQRYLKRKKERRKVKKPTDRDKGTAATEAQEDADEDAVSDTGGGGDEPVTSMAVPVSEAESTEAVDKKKKKKKEKKTHAQEAEEDLAIEEERTERRPKKRRKVPDEETNGPVLGVHNLDAATPSLPDSIPESMDVDPQSSSGPPARVPAPPLTALPSFPLPVRPDAPSKIDLALQGLDKALVDAEIVDPARILPIPTDGAEDGGTGLSERCRRRLLELEITSLFAVQTALLPFLLPPDPLQRALYVPYRPPRDACVSAPTGSGKTLAYVLPIVEILSTRIVTRLRALIVLPTRDLVAQVRETFDVIGKGRGLKFGTATGQHSFAHEQTQLVGDTSNELQGGSSKVDVLICTPGRLIDHITSTPNFTLQHLRFLVIDEADRLLAQSFQDWLAQVLAATRPPSKPLSSPSDFSVPGTTLPYPDAIAPAFYTPHTRTTLDERRQPSCQKLLFSATLTRDPGKIRGLDLHAPRYFVVQDSAAAEGGHGAVLEGLAMERFSMPATLKEHMLVCGSAQKPLMLFHLVRAHGVTNALVFTKSAEATARLVALFELFERARGDVGDTAPKTVVRAYSSDLAAGERRSILERFKTREIDILVCSDLISRGIDISHVSHVVSYDAPVDMRKYVHRVGRTARAGRDGDSWTLIEEQEARFFKSMMKSVDHLDKVKRLRVADKDIAPLLPAYETALAGLKDVYSRE